MQDTSHQPLPFLDHDPASEGLQFLENIATAYWYSQLLFSALSIDLFSVLDDGHATVDDIAGATGCRSHELGRLLRGLLRMNLLARHRNTWFNGIAASRYLVRGKPDYMGEFFLYRQYMQPNWQQLTARLEGRQRPVEQLDYTERNFRYVRAMDCLVRQKSAEIARMFHEIALPGPLLDVGGGAGSLLRAIRDQAADRGEDGQEFRGVLFELAEVIDAARTLYPDADDWRQLTTVAGDFRSHAFTDRFGGVLLSNVLHAYGHDEARTLFHRALDLLDDDGFILIHDYFPDHSAMVAEKGALYDLCMMLNTYDGECHEVRDIRQWLAESERGREMPLRVVDLATDSTVIVCGGPEQWHNEEAGWLSDARELGFAEVAAIAPEQVVTAPWVAKKCRYGCPGFGKNLQCPPHTDSADETSKLLAGYRTALLVQGQPPGREFHRQLLELERRTFLRGYHKALVYGAGSCTLCDRCPVDGVCRRPDQARPAMEASGIDVYATARSVGWNLDVVRDRDGFVKYIGLLLVE
ncbi:MAG: DUF2284 domain-containing protein [Desulfopila sp.]